MKKYTAQVRDNLLKWIEDNVDYYNLGGFEDAEELTEYVEKILNDNYEWLDIRTRLEVFPSVAYKVAKEIFEQKEKGKERMENKVAICADLLKTLQKTNDGKNITDLVYAKSTNTDDEHVIIVWSNGDEKAVEIGGDRDGIRMIRDITRVIYYGKEN